MGGSPQRPQDKELKEAGPPYPVCVLGLGHGPGVMATRKEERPSQCLQLSPTPRVSLGPALYLPCSDPGTVEQDMGRKPCGVTVPPPGSFPFLLSVLRPGSSWVEQPLGLPWHAWPILKANICS